MTTTKKRRERQSLNTVLDRIALSPNHVEEAEKPDFLLTIDDTKVGAEVTELYLPFPKDAHLPIQAAESEARLMVEIACKKAEQRKIPPQQVAVRISRHFLKKRTVNACLRHSVIMYRQRGLTIACIGVVGRPFPTPTAPSRSSSRPLCQIQNARAV